MTEVTILVGDQIRVGRMLTLRSALKLEIIGLKRRGRTVYSIIKKEFGLKGTKQRVLEQFSALIDKELENANRRKDGESNPDRLQDQLVNNPT